MNKLLNKQLGDILKSSRVKSGLTVRQVAKKIDKAHTTVSDHELGKISISVEVLFQYCDVYDLNPTKVLKEINYKQK